MLGSPGAHLILIFTRHVNEGRVERGSAWKDKRRISLYRLFGSKQFMPCASIKSLFADLSTLAVPSKFANLPRESRNVRIIALSNHPSSQEDDPGDIRRGGSGIAALRLACEASRVRPRLVALYHPAGGCPLFLYIIWKQNFSPIVIMS
jgi:hypothetical protein